MKVTDWYADYACEISDAPRLYHQWLAYLILASVVNKNVWMDQGGFMKMYPNLYLLIIGPSSLYRKSFSQRLAASIIKEIVPDFQLIDTSSREAFISELSRNDRTPQGSGLILIDELAGFMERAKKSHHFSGYIQDLSSAFDGMPIQRRTGVSEDEKIIYRVDEPFVNLTAACSFDWLTKSIETSDLTGGFLARFLWIIPPEKSSEHWAKARRGDIAKRRMIIERLNEIRGIMGEIIWDDDTEELYSYWYSAFREENKGGRWDANFERMTSQTRKLAMLNAVQDLRLTVNEDDFTAAFSMVMPLVPHLNQVAIGDNPDEIVREKILKYMRKIMPVSATKSDLHNNVRGLDKRRLDAALETLLDADLIIAAAEPEMRGGRPLVRYLLPISRVRNGTH